MIPVILESPYNGPDAATIERNIRYARRAMADCLARGEAPYASHLLYTQPGVLRDEIPEERALGISAGFAWRRLARRTVVYADLGISAGMRAGMEHARNAGHVVETRYIGTDEPARKEMIEVPLVTGGKAPVEATVVGAWAAHHAIGSAAFPVDPRWPWSVTYVATGMCLPWRFVDEVAAIAVARVLNDRFPSMPAVPPKSLKGMVKAAIDEAMAGCAEATSVSDILEGRQL